MISNKEYREQSFRDAEVRMNKLRTHQNRLVVHIDDVQTPHEYVAKLLDSLVASKDIPEFELYEPHGGHELECVMYEIEKEGLNSPDLVISCLVFGPEGPEEGIRIIKRVRDKYPEVPIICWSKWPEDAPVWRNRFFGLIPVEYGEPYPLVREAARNHKIETLKKYVDDDEFREAIIRFLK